MLTLRLIEIPKCGPRTAFGCDEVDADLEPCFEPQQNEDVDDLFSTPPTALFEVFTCSAFTLSARMAKCFVAVRCPLR